MNVVSIGSGFLNVFDIQIVQGEKMNFTRREALMMTSSVFVAAGIGFPSGAKADCGTCEKPDPRTFASGDLLWTKNPYRIVPYGGLQIQGSSAEMDWLKQRARLIEELEQKSSRTEFEAELLTSLRTLTAAEFSDAYLDGIAPGQLQPHGGTAGDPREYTGHVAIVDLVPDTDVMVIEAVTPRVRRIPFPDWVSANTCNNVWHGRLGDISAENRAAVALEARKHVGKPYSLFGSLSSFHLDDVRDFYCSKLVWHTVKQVTGVALDGKAYPERLLPVSPKQLLESRLVTLLHACGDFAWSTQKG